MAADGLFEVFHLLAPLKISTGRDRPGCEYPIGFRGFRLYAVQGRSSGMLSDAEPKGSGDRRRVLTQQWSALWQPHRGSRKPDRVMDDRHFTCRCMWRSSSKATLLHLVRLHRLFHRPDWPARHTGRTHRIYPLIARLGDKGPFDLLDQLRLIGDPGRVGGVARFIQPLGTADNVLHDLTPNPFPAEGHLQRPVASLEHTDRLGGRAAVSVAPGRLPADPVAKSIEISHR